MGNLAVTAWVGFTLGYVRLSVCGYTLVNWDLKIVHDGRLGRLDEYHVTQNPRDI